MCCALLNRTGRSQVRPLFERLFQTYRSPAELAAAEAEELAELLRPLGFQNKRARLLAKLSSDCAAGVPPALCHGVGQYALDAHAIFVEGRTDVSPADHFLKPYLRWRNKHVTQAKD